MSQLRCQEEWRPIAGAEGYYSVSSHGRVRSEPLPHKSSGRQRGRVLSPSRDTKGYLIFKLCLPGRSSKTKKVHRLVARAFLGTPPEGAQVNHKNGEKTDNRPENLEYVSCGENIRHCWETGLHGVSHCRGEANPNTPLSRSDVIAIRELHPRLNYKKLASMYGVTGQTIRNIVKRITWNHV